MTGCTERAILMGTLAVHDIAYPEDKLDDFYAALAVAANELRGRMRSAGQRLPGVPEAITALAREGIVQTIVTGNIKPIAMTKLEVFDLADRLDFEVGGYGSDGNSRPPLIRQAWQRAEQKYRVQFPGQRVIIIGDTPLDIAAAREVGVRSVGVATGSSSIDELTSAQADAVVPDLTDTPVLIRAVFGQGRQE